MPPPRSLEATPSCRGHCTPTGCRDPAGSYAPLISRAPAGEPHAAGAAGRRSRAPPSVVEAVPSPVRRRSCWPPVPCTTSGRGGRPHPRVSPPAGKVGEAAAAGGRPALLSEATPRAVGGRPWELGPPPDAAPGPMCRLLPMEIILDRLGRRCCASVATREREGGRTMVAMGLGRDKVERESVSQYECLVWKLWIDQVAGDVFICKLITYFWITKRF